MKIVLLILITILRIDNLVLKQNMNLQKEQIIERILRNKFPELKNKNRKLLLTVSKRNTDIKPNRKNFTVSSLKPKFLPYNPISLAFFGDYKVKVRKNNFVKDHADDKK